MRTVLFFAFLTATTATALACDGPTRTKVGPNGKTVTICLDGKKSTCIQDGMAQGHSREAATAFCSRNARLK